MFNVLKYQVFVCCGLLFGKIEFISSFLPLPGRRHVDARVSAADDFRAANDVSVTLGQVGIPSGQQNAVVSSVQMVQH